MSLRSLLILAVLFVAKESSECGVLLVTIDGLRSDVVGPELTPALQGVIDRGAWTLEAQSLPPTLTIPNHVSMITGLTPETHEIVVPEDVTYVEESVITIARGAGLTVAAYLSKEKLRLLADPSFFNKFDLTPDGLAEPVIEEFIEDVSEVQGGWDLALVHIADPDKEGHVYGWMSVEYICAVERADEYLRRVLDALESQNRLEETLLIVTSDHGGTGTDHTENTIEVTHVPWVVAGPGILPDQEIAVSVGTHDTAPTVLRYLGIETPVTMEGVSVESAFIDGRDATRFIRGDLNADARVSLSDAVGLLQHLFGGGAVECVAAGDVDGDGALVLSDAVYVLEHLFAGGSPPSAPYPKCKPVRDLTLSCNTTCPLR